MEAGIVEAGIGKAGIVEAGRLAGSQQVRCLTGDSDVHEGAARSARMRGVTAGLLFNTAGAKICFRMVREPRIPSSPAPA
jgi:hypothetical protein